MLDQSYDPASSTATYILADFELAQTFTAGVDGTLASVDVLVWRTGDPAHDLLFDLRPVDPGTGAPVEDEASALANVTIAAASVSTSPGFLDINLRQPR